MFYDHIHLKFDGGKNLYKTVVGAALTVCFIALIVGFGMQRLIKMVTFVDANVKTNV
jgi:hypothetical protein